MKQSCIPDLELHLCHDARKNAGEDSWFCCVGKTAAGFGVFDGCGGSGAQRHDCYSKQTEAYMASRFCAGAFYDSFQDVFPGQGGSVEALEKQFVELSRVRVTATMKEYGPQDSGMKFKGSMIRQLPSTAAVVLIQSADEGIWRVTAIWAGDSRCYLLLPNSLAQLSTDDSTEPDPMETLYSDGVLTNVISGGKQPDLHVKTLRCRPPFAVLTATDGCFGYFSTPMEFEGALLGTMAASQTPAEWEEKLSAAIGRVAGDDYTLCLGAYGYQDFSKMKESFAPRLAELHARWLDRLQTLPLDDLASRRAM